MSQAVHLITKNVLGCGPSESRCLPHSGTSAKSVALFPLSSFRNNRTFSQVKIGSLKYMSGAAIFMCRASSGGPRRNSDSSKQNRQSFSRNRSRHNEEKDTFENLDVSDLLTSNNGPLLSLSNTPKFQATAAPGPREKEIVELFRKVQAQLRERAAVKEEKKVEATKGKGKEGKTVDSLLKLLRKHSIEQGKKKGSNISGGDSGLDQPENNGVESEDRNTSSHDDKNKERTASAQLKPISTSISRPPSNFRRKSPVPKLKFDAIYSSEGPVNSSHMNLTKEKKKQFEAVPDKDEQPQLDMDLEETELELEQEQESSSYPGGGTFNELLDGEPSDTENNERDNDKEPHSEHEDLSSLKLPELRALAKSHGIKGFSKMKKGDLVELLSSK